MDIKTLTIEQLKALAYDCLASIELTQKNLQIINQEIVLRNQPKEEVKPETKEGN